MNNSGDRVNQTARPCSGSRNEVQRQVLDGGDVMGRDVEGGSQGVVEG